MFLGSPQKVDFLSKNQHLKQTVLLDQRKYSLDSLNKGTGTQGFQEQGQSTSYGSIQEQICHNYGTLNQHRCVYPFCGSHKNHESQVKLHDCRFLTSLFFSQQSLSRSWCSHQIDIQR